MATRLTKLQVGGALATLATGVVLGVYGGNISTNRGVDFRPQTGVSTGAVIQINGTTEMQIFKTACTNTGGLAKYTGPCIVRSPLTTTGAIKDISLECQGTNKTLSMSGGFVKASTTPVTSAFTNMRTKSVSTGSYLSLGTGSLLWNPADLIKFQTVTTFPSGGANCLVRVQMHDFYGE